MKGGLLFSDYLTTVSPTFAREILDPKYGEGLDGVLRERADRLTGILNGLDAETWNPEHDPLLERNYSTETLDAKSVNTIAVRAELGLSDGSNEPLIAVIGRLAHQKGIDELLDALPDLLTLPVQLAILGSGDRRYEQALKKIGAKFPGRLAVHIGFDEALAHRLEAGADMLLMPSRFEPCGLTQMQSLRYGTVPVVARCGGLIDTVTETTPASLADSSATGFFIDPLSPEEIVATVQRAVGLFRRPRDWRRLMRQGMQQDFSWEQSARCYEAVYRKALAASRQEEPGVARLAELSALPGRPQ
jgi:starch synthase